LLLKRLKKTVFWWGFIKWLTKIKLMRTDCTYVFMIYFSESLLIRTENLSDRLLYKRILLLLPLVGALWLASDISSVRSTYFPSVV
jgi:hypothetical protein